MKVDRITCDLTIFVVADGIIHSDEHLDAAKNLADKELQQLEGEMGEGWEFREIYIISTDTAAAHWSRWTEPKGGEQ